LIIKYLQPLVLGGYDFWIALFQSPQAKPLEICLSNLTNMSKKTSLANLAKQTLEIIDRGFYLQPEGKKINLAQALTQAKENTVHYRPEDFKAIFEQRDAIFKSQHNTQTLDFEVLNQTTFQGCQQLLAEGFSKVYALNFASAKNAGGGFLGGAQAQEESLARASGLYACLLQAPDYYATHRSLSTCLYTDNMIYSPQVPVFRNDKGDLLPEYYLVSFITSPAVNQNGMKAKPEKPEAFAQIPAVMRARIEKILSLAVVQGYEAIVLGAWGCGVFQNQPLEVAGYFREFLLEHSGFKHFFKKVIFSVLDSSAEERFIHPFREVFNC
jgi:uncharacterized protein (TIGR02452 family)